MISVDLQPPLNVKYSCLLQRSDQSSNKTEIRKDDAGVIVGGLYGILNDGRDSVVD
jgi:hypothetical protein